MTHETQGVRLSKAYPQLYAALAATWYQGKPWTETREGRYNDAGYWLWAMNQVAARVASQFAQKNYLPHELDRFATREVIYHFHKGSQFRNVTVALARCVINCVGERPERLEEARRIAATKKPSAPPTAPQAPAVQQRSGQTTLAGVLGHLNHATVGGHR